MRVLVVSLFNGIGGAFRAYDLVGVEVAGLISFNLTSARQQTESWPEDGLMPLFTLMYGSSRGRLSLGGFSNIHTLQSCTYGGDSHAETLVLCASTGSIWLVQRVDFSMNS